MILFLLGFSIMINVKQMSIYGGFGGVDAVAPCLLLGFALSDGSEPQGAEQGADQQCMGTCVWVDAQRCRGCPFRRYA